MTMPEDIEHSLPDWQKEMIDHRLIIIEKNPECLLPIDKLMEELSEDRE